VLTVHGSQNWFFPVFKTFWSLHQKGTAMQITVEQRSEIIAKFRTHESDTGSPEVQIALLTARINQLTEHFRVHSKDFAGRRGLLALVSQRRSLLDYLKRKNVSSYQKIIGELNIRR
jgi:small subunit ribosomal protein S15